MADTEQGNTRSYDVSERRRREIARALALYEKDLQKTKDTLEARELVEGMKEASARLADVTMLRRQFSIQGDLLDGEDSRPTPIEGEIQNSASGSEEPKVQVQPEEGTEVAWPDGTKSTVTHLLGYDANREAFEVIDSREGARLIFLEPIAKEWRVLELVLEYPPSTPPEAGAVAEEFTGVSESETKAEEPATPSGRKKPRRGGAPTPIGSTVAKVARKAGAKVATATGQPKIPIGKRGKKK